MSRLFDADAGALRQPVGPTSAGLPSGRGAVHYVCGTYAAYSHAWSPYFQDQLSRGRLLIEPGRGSRFAASYSERLPSGPVELDGTANLVGGVLHIDLREAGSGAPFFVSVLLSGRPASVLSGVASGATLAGPDPLPSTTRIALIRLPEGGAEASGSNSYLALDPAAIGTNLVLLGIRPAAADPPAADRAAAGLWAFLSAVDRGGMTQVSQAAHARLARCFDPVELPA